MTGYIEGNDPLLPEFLKSLIERCSCLYVLIHAFISPENKRNVKMCASL